MPKDDCVLLFGLVKSAQKKHRIVFFFQEHIKAAAKKSHNAASSDILIKKAVTIAMYHLLGHFVYRT